MVEDISSFQSHEPPKSKKGLVTAVIVAAIIVFCLCSLVCLAAGGYGIWATAQEGIKFYSVLDDYMKKMEARDVEGAYALFAPQARQQMSLAELKTRLEGSNYARFENYQSLTVRQVHVQANYNEVQVATVDGAVNYSGGLTGSFEAELQLVGEQWLLTRMDVQAPPEKTGE